VADIERGQVPTVTVDKVVLNYEVSENGPETVLLINGLGDSLDTWGPIWDALCQAGYTTVRIDNRGVGKSTTPPGPYLISDMARDAKVVVDELGLGEAHLIGASMGGSIALEFASAYREQVRSLTLMCSPPKTDEWLTGVLRSARRMAVEFGVQQTMEILLNWLMTPKFFNERSDELRGLVSELYGAAPQPLEGFLGQIDGLLAFEGPRSEVPQVPTHVIRGESDILIPAQLALSVRDQIDDVEVSICPGGHGFFWEHPELSAELILRFLGRTGHGR
jgi:3-oxoadipate enol-lactonase